MVKCSQIKCAFHSSRGKLAESMCPICSDCQSPSNEVNEDCVECWNCLKDEGIIRFGRKGQHLNKTTNIIIIGDINDYQKEKMLVEKRT